MPKPKLKQRAYTPKEFRQVLITLYGPGTDWELAGLACPDFNVKRLTIYRYLTGDRLLGGTAAAVPYLLLELKELKERKDRHHGEPYDNESV